LPSIQVSISSGKRQEHKNQMSQLLATGWAIWKSTWRGKNKWCNLLKTSTTKWLKSGIKVL